MHINVCYISAVALEDRSIVTASDQTITCVMTGISQTATVSWKDPDGATISDGDDYTVVQGTESGGAQESTLTTKTAKLQAFGTTSTFTCDVTSGQYPDSDTSSTTMTLTTLTFGKFCKNKQKHNSV